jgi:hypothetical protein
MKYSTNSTQRPWPSNRSAKWLWYRVRNEPSGFRYRLSPMAEARSPSNAQTS